MSRKADSVPATLAEATEQLQRKRPKLDAEPGTWIAFHRRCAEVYSQVARIDLSHRHEALAFAAQELRQARGIEDRLAES